MTTRREKMLGWSTKPDNSGEVFFEPYGIKATNGKWDRMVGIFNDSATKDGLHGSFDVPKGYVDTANLIIVWTSIATSGDVDWELEYRAVGGDDTESLDQATAQESVPVNDIAPSAINERMEVSVSLTDGNFAIDDTVSFILFRDGVVEAGGGIVAAVILFGLFFEYNDS